MVELKESPNNQSDERSQDKSIWTKFEVPIIRDTSLVGCSAPIGSSATTRTRRWRIVEFLKLLLEAFQMEAD